MDRGRRASRHHARRLSNSSTPRLWTLPQDKAKIEAWSTTIELTGDAEVLASKVAQKRGVSIEQAVVEAIAYSARKAGLLEENAKLSPEQVIQALDELSRRHVARPVGWIHAPFS